MAKNLSSFGGVQSIKHLPARHLSQTQRALIILKPDGIQYFGSTIRILSDHLTDRGINFRFVLPTITSITPKTAELLYVEKGIRYDNHRKFMAAGYEDQKIISSPVIAMFVEAELKVGSNLIDILRSHDVIGPTNLEKELLTADEAVSQQIMQSIRYLFTFGEGKRIWPFPYVQDALPMYNRIHCSASGPEAVKEIGLFYKNREKELLLQYDKNAINALNATWESIPKALDITRTSLIHLFTENSDPAGALYDIFKGLNYRDFGKRECYKLAFEINDVIPLLGRINNNYIDNFGKNISSGVGLDFSTKPSYKARVIAICGDVGSGKSTLSDLLINNGIGKNIVLYTTRDKRGTEQEGIDYNFIGFEKFIDLMAQGSFLGVDRIGNTLYGVHELDLHPANLQDKAGIIVSGPNTIAALRKSLTENLDFTAIFLKCSPKTLIERLNKRGTEIGSALENRIARVKDTEARYSPWMPYFDLIINGDNALPKQTLKKVLAFVEETGTKVHGRTDIDSDYFKMTPKRRMIQFLFDKYILKAPFSADKSEVLEDLEISIRETYEKPLQHFLEELCKDQKSRSYLTKEEEDTITESIIRHKLNTFAVCSQIDQDLPTIKLSDKRLGRLTEYSDDARVRHNLEKIQKAARNISDYEKRLILFSHDIGKILRFVGHPELSWKLIGDNNLFEFADIPEENKKLDRLFVKYHQLVGDFVYGFISYTGVIDMFKDPESICLFKNGDGSVNIKLIKDFFDRHRFMTACDVAGSLSDKGGLKNINLELYYEFIDGLQAAFENNSGSYEDAVKELRSVGPKYQELQLTGMLLGFDPLGDTREGTQYYWDIIVKSKQNAIDKGVITENDWSNILNDLAHIDNKYCPHLWWIYFGPSPEKKEKHEYYISPQEPPVSFWNSFSTISSICRENIPGFGEDHKVVLTYFDKSGKEIAGRQKEYDAALEEHELFDACTGYKLDNNIITFVDRAGAKINNVTAQIIKHENFHEIRFDHHNLKYDDKTN